MKQLLPVQNIILGAIGDNGNYVGDDADGNYEADADYDGDANCDYNQAPQIFGLAPPRPVKKISSPSIPGKYFKTWSGFTP